MRRNLCDFSKFKEINNNIDFESNWVMILMVPTNK